MSCFIYRHVQCKRISMICARFSYHMDDNLHVIVKELMGVSVLTNHSEGEITDVYLWLCFSKIC